MSQSELESLLETEGVDVDGLDELVSWARDKAGALLESVGDDTELSPLLNAGGTAGAEVELPRPQLDAESGPGGANLEAQSVTQSPDYSDQDVTQPRAKMPQPDPAPLPPIPVSTKSDEDDEEIEEIEELDVEELELLEDDDEDEDESDDDASEEADGSGESFGDSVAGPMPSLTDGPIRPDGAKIPEESSADRLPEPPMPEAMLAAAMQPEGDGAPVPGPEPEQPPQPENEAENEAAADAPTFGPPDGTESVPAWKAALFSAQTGDDGLAAQKVQEESTATRLPTAPEERDEGSVATRLVAEEDEISQHSVDLSDLDLDD